MKRTATLFIVLAALLLSSATSSFAQDEQQKADQPLTFREVFNAPFPAVWKSIKQALGEDGCLVEHEKYSEADNGTYKGKLTSLFCVLAAGEDSTEEVMERYSKRVPYIRGGYWTSVRMQYIFYVTEKEDHTVQLILKGEISGYEEHVTHQFHYFDTNGVLEQRIIDKLKRLVALNASQE